MRKILLVAIVSLLVMSLVASAGYAAAASDTQGAFPNRTFLVERLPPGGPRSDTYTVSFTAPRSGMWSVEAMEIAGSAVIVEVWWMDGGVEQLLSSSKLRYAEDMSTPTQMFASFPYAVSFTPFGKRGVSVLEEKFSAPSPPVASFTVDSAAPLVGQMVTFDATPSSDPDNDIVSYAWDFDDGVGSGSVVYHAYGAAGTYDVVLTVTDSAGLSDTASATLAVAEVPNEVPIVTFRASREFLTAFVDATGSIDLDGSIVDYHWVWGDSQAGSSGLSPTAEHTYAAPGKYTIILHAMDDDSGIGTTNRDVSVGTTTVDFMFYDFFDVPFGEWWDLRTLWWGDLPIGADCFSAEGIANGDCTPSTAAPDVSAYPYTVWSPTLNDAAIFAPYRLSADIKNHPAYTIDRPVILPSCEALAAMGLPVTCPSGGSGGTVVVDASISQVTRSMGGDLAARACPGVLEANDGYLTEFRMTLAMDGTAASRLFGVTDGASWANGTDETALIRAGCGPGSIVDTKSGQLEKALKAWLESQGNGAYDVYNSFRQDYTVAAIELWGGYDAGSGMHRLFVSVIGWGNEALAARWFYWGATSYRDGVTSGANPAGWLGMEVPGLESVRLSGTIGSSFTGRVDAVVQYHFRHSATAGGDGYFVTADDVPEWVWEPILGDRLPGLLDHSISEMNKYAGLTYTHTTVGSRRYGALSGYDYTPTVWALKAGEIQTFDFPNAIGVLYDPYLSARIGSPAGLSASLTLVEYAYSEPISGGWAYDPVLRLLVALGPSDPGMPPLSAGGAPLDSRPSYHLTKG